MAEEWGPWIEHDGKGCPPAGKFSQWRFDCPHEFPVGMVDSCGNVLLDDRTVQGIPSNSKSWNWHPSYLHVVRYRIRRPLGLRRLIDLAADPEKGLPPRFPVEELA